MKKYIDAQLQVVRVNNKDIITESAQFSTTVTDVQLGADRFRDFEDYSY